MRLLFLLLLSLNVQALQLLQPINGQNTIQQKLGQFEQSLPTTKILTQLNKDAKSGNARAQFSLANMYHHGINTRKDIKLAFYWYAQVAELGYPTAQFNLAEFYYKGVNTPKDWNQAVFWYEKAAQQNFIKAQYKLAKMYHRKGDMKEAGYWYQRSAKLGFSPAQLDLGELYEKGDGIDKDLKLAQHWYEKAAMQFNTIAQLRLNQMMNAKQSAIKAPSTEEIARSLAENLKILDKESVKSGQ
jgi:TPR repeat protein